MASGTCCVGAYIGIPLPEFSLPVEALIVDSASIF